MPEGRKFSTWGYVELFGVWSRGTNIQDDALRLELVT